MMAAARTPSEPDSADLDQEIADLWADGFDTVSISEILTDVGSPMAEADVCRILAAQREERRNSTEAHHDR